MPLEQEQKAYERELPKLLASTGKFVLISGDVVSDIFDTYHDALKAGYDRFGLKPFLVKQIAAVESVQHFTRDIKTRPI
jgi:hypothetical protein